MICNIQFASNRTLEASLREVLIQRASKISINKGVQLTEIYREMVVYGNTVRMTQRNVYEWIERFGKIKEKHF